MSTSVRAALAQAPAEQCDVAELLASPWRHAVGVWRVGDSLTSHPKRWRWELVVNGARLFVSNDRNAMGGRSIADHELACVLEAAELAAIDSADFAEALRRRGANGTITRESVYITRGDQCGQRVTLGAVLKRLRVALVKAEVRP